MCCGDTGIQVSTSVFPRKEKMGPSSLHKNLCVGALFFVHHVSLVALHFGYGQRTSLVRRRPALGNGLQKRLQKLLVLTRQLRTDEVIEKKP
jgi:hypothetical protein